MVLGITYGNKDNIMKKLLLTAIFSLPLFANITLDNNESFEMSMEENLTINGTLSIPSDANFVAREDSSINISGDFINKGSFTPSTSTINFFGLGVSKVKGESEFYNFFSNKNLSFEANKTQEITHRFTLKDADINSTTTGVQGIINLATVDSINVKNLNIKDSKIIGRAEAINPPNSTDNSNNFLWFNHESKYQNIGSGHDWFDKLKDNKDSEVAYLTKENNQSSEVIFSDSLNVLPTVQEDKKIVKFDYEAVLDSGNACSKDIEIKLGRDSTIKSGYKGCSYEDPTLKNWEDFKNAKVVIKDLGNGSSKSVIIIDVNLTSPLIIGAIHAN